QRLDVEGEAVADDREVPAAAAAERRQCLDAGAHPNGASDLGEQLLGPHADVAVAVRDHLERRPAPLVGRRQQLRAPVVRQVLVPDVRRDVIERERAVEVGDYDHDGAVAPPNVATTGAWSLVPYSRIDT